MIKLEKQRLSNKLKMKEMGEVSSVFGIKLKRYRDSIKVDLLTFHVFIQQHPWITINNCNKYVS